MTKPTKDRIAKQVNALKEIKPKVRHFSIFGDDNQAAVEAQIKVLEGKLDPDDAEGVAQSAADEAAEWLKTGETADGQSDLCEGWVGLIQ
jgi:hypothetical protein